MAIDTTVVTIVPIVGMGGFLCLLFTCIFGMVYCIRRARQQSMYGGNNQQQTVVYQQKDTYGQNLANPNPPCH